MSKTVDLRKSQTCPLADGLGGKKRIEYLRKHVVGNADAGVPDLDGHKIALDDAIVHENIAGLNRHLAALRHGIAGIEDQIDQRRFELGGIYRDRPYAVVCLDLQFDRAAEPGVEHIAHREDAVAHVDGLGIDALPARERQKLAGQRGPSLRGRVDGLHGTERFRIVRRDLLQRVEAARNDHREDC